MTTCGCKTPMRLRVMDTSYFFADEKIGQRMSLTPEGFLLCEGVPLARTGEQVYGPGELPGLELGPDGVLIVDRPENEVFRPETIASFEGKDATNDHPPEDVLPENWKRYSVGHVQNIRRGEGEFSDYLLGDMIIKDAAAIDAVREGKREVSCGYDAEYEQTAPGRARQYDITGNHVAIVLRGRCGHRCSIGDEAMKTKDKKYSWRDRLAAAFKSRDSEEFEKAMSEAPKDKVEDEDTTGEELGGGDTHVHVHLPGEGGKKEPETQDDGEADLPEYFKKFKEAHDAQMGELSGNLKTLGDAFQKFLGEEQDEGTHDEDAEGKEDDEGKTDDAEGKEDNDKKTTGDKTKDAKGKTMDSANLQAAFTDTVARAEILWPGVKVPTFDAKSDRVRTIDSMCKLRRRVLDHAMEDDANRSLIETMTGKKGIRFTDNKTMTCDSVRQVFVATSEAAKARNNAAGVRKAAAQTRDEMNKTHRTQVADVNKRNREFWTNRA